MKIFLVIGLENVIGRKMIDYERKINFDHLLETYDKGTLQVFSPIDGKLVGVVIKIRL